MTGQTVAVVQWGNHDALARAFGAELQQLAYKPLYFRFDQSPPLEADIVLSFAPYGRWLQIPTALAKRSNSSGPRPRLIHWNTENPPDLRLPWWLVRSVGALRVRVDRWHDADDRRTRQRVQQPPFAWFAARLSKFRYVGEVHYAAGQGWLDVYAESSEIYARLHARHGLPTAVVPWGTVPEWCADLNLERDLDVVWFGQRRTARRARLLERLRGELHARGIKIFVADGVEHPFVHGPDRTRLLNRAKVTLNLLPTWYDHAFPYRFHVAAGNRSLVVTEPMLPHSPHYHAGEHYICAPIPQLADTIAFHVRHAEERRAIAEQAHALVTTQMTMNASVRALMSHLSI